MQIRRVKIERYRGIEGLVWCPGPGLNCLVGPGDVGKSTVLDAIATVLSPAPGRVASEYDYLNGDVVAGFEIDLVIGSLDEEILAAWSPAPLWTWIADQQRVQADPDPDGEEVIYLRATGTEDLEVEHFVIDPSEGVGRLSTANRQKFGLSTLGAAGLAYRNLRLSRGSLLARNIEPEPLRGLVAESVKATRDKFSPPAEVNERLRELSKALEEIAPGTGALSLAMLSPRGQNLLGMIGLFAASGDSDLPLTSMGFGTQQLALYTLAKQLISAVPIFVIDEIESGLEPFRQRDLIARIRKQVADEGQAFITTHSPAAVGEMQLSELKRVERDAGGRPTIADLPAGLGKIHGQDPEALLCRLPVMLEGKTEMGVVGLLLEEHAKKKGTTLGALGFRLVDGEGQPQVFTSTEAFRSAGRRFAAFLDDEEDHSGKRNELAEDEGVAFGTYSAARCLEDALSQQLVLDDLDQLIATPGADGRDRSVDRYQQLNEAAGDPGRKTLVELERDLGEDRCRELFRDVAGKDGWFKTPATSVAVGQFLRDQRAGLQIVTDVAILWTEMIELVGDELPDMGDGGLDT